VLLIFELILNVIITLTYIKHHHPLFTFQLATAVAIWISCSMPGNIRIQNPKHFPKDFLIKIMYLLTHMECVLVLDLFQSTKG